MSASDQAFGLLAIVVCLGACFICAFCEIEAWRQRQRRRVELVRNAMRSVVTVGRDRE